LVETNFYSSRKDAEAKFLRALYYFNLVRYFGDVPLITKYVQRMKDHAAYEVSVAEANKTQIATNVKEHMILMPIPQREIDLRPNDPGFKQNLGWD
jgi:hypothetical protein